MTAPLLYWNFASGTATFHLNLAATADSQSIGNASFPLALPVQASGGTNADSEGTANFLPLSVQVAVTGVIAIATPVRVFTQEEILTGNRNTKFRIDVLDINENTIAELDGFREGKLDWIANAVIKGGGSMTVYDVGQAIDWLNARLRPVMMIKGLPEQPLGVFLVSESPKAVDKGSSWALKLLDKTTIPQQDTVAATYALPTGAVVTTEVINLLISAGITNYSVTPSSATLLSPLVWKAGTSKLKIINDLLSVINYFSLYANLNGQLVAEPYTLPAKRPIMYEFIDGPESIYVKQFVQDVDQWYIPNQVTVTSLGDGTNPVLTSTQQNTNPDSKYSTVRRGRVIGYSEEGVVVTDQPTLDAYTKRKLVDKTSPTSSLTIMHAPVPGLLANNATRFRNVSFGVDKRHVVSETSITLDGKALAETKLTEVVDV